MLKQYGIKVYDDANNVLGILWQHLEASEIEETITGAPTLRGVLYDWSGDWEPGHPIAAIPTDDKTWWAVDQYEIVSRVEQ